MTSARIYLPGKPVIRFDRDGRRTTQRLALERAATLAAHSDPFVIVDLDRGEVKVGDGPALLYARDGSRLVARWRPVVMVQWAILRELDVGTAVNLAPVDEPTRRDLQNLHKRIRRRGLYLVAPEYRLLTTLKT